MKTIPDQNPVDIFLKSWRVYQEVIEHNYMFHREIADAVRLALVSGDSGVGLRVLDLGCGDASMAAPMLSSSHVASYVGCDLSQPALDIAQSNISRHGITVQLSCSDMLQFMASREDASADLLISSYAIHHLAAEDKQKLIREAARVLSPEGRFMVIDVFRESGEPRDAYIAHYMQTLRETWSALSEESRDLIVGHATQYDFPETPAFYNAACLENGFDAGRCLAKHTWHQAWLFTKRAMAIEI